jgi:hypothetical protein
VTVEDELAKVVGGDQLVTDPDVMAAHQVDWTSGAGPGPSPDPVTRPR